MDQQNSETKQFEKNLKIKLGLICQIQEGYGLNCKN